MSESDIWSKVGLPAMIHFISSYLLFSSITDLRNPFIDHDLAIMIWAFTLILMDYSFFRAYRDPEIEALNYAKLSATASLIGGAAYLSITQYLSLGKIHLDVSGALLLTGISILLVLPVIYRLKSRNIEGILGVSDERVEKIKEKQESEE